MPSGVFLWWCLSLPHPVPRVCSIPSPSRSPSLTLSPYVCLALRTASRRTTLRLVIGDGVPLCPRYPVELVMTADYTGPENVRHPALVLGCRSSQQRREWITFLKSRLRSEKYLASLDRLYLQRTGDKRLDFLREEHAAQMAKVSQEQSRILSRASTCVPSRALPCPAVVRRDVKWRAYTTPSTVWPAFAAAVVATTQFLTPPLHQELKPSCVVAWLLRLLLPPCLVGCVCARALPDTVHPYLCSDPVYTTGVSGSLSLRQFDAVGCGLWAVGCGLWAVGCGLWAVGCGLWAVGCGDSVPKPMAVCVCAGSAWQSPFSNVVLPFLCTHRFPGSRNVLYLPSFSRWLCACVRRAAASTQ